MPLSEMVRLEFGAFAGLGFGGTFKVLEESGGFSEISGGGFPLEADATVEVELSRKMSIFGQMGYHLFKSSQVQPVFGGVTGNDPALFVDPAAVGLSGLVIMFGLGIRLPW